MRLAILLTDLGDRSPHRAAIALAEAAASAGHEADLVAGSPHGALRSARSPRLGAVDLGRRTAAGMAFTLSRYLAERRPALLVAATADAGTVAGAAALLSRSATRILWLATESEPQEPVALPWPAWLWRAPRRRAVPLPLDMGPPEVLLRRCLAELR